MSDWVCVGGRWLHRPWWKRAINTALRAVQPFVARKWVIVSCGEVADDGAPLRVLGYRLEKVLHR